MLVDELAACWRLVPGWTAFFSEGRQPLPAFGAGALGAAFVAKLRHLPGIELQAIGAEEAVLGIGHGGGAAEHGLVEDMGEAGLYRVFGHHLVHEVDAQGFGGIAERVKARLAA